MSVAANEQKYLPRSVTRLLFFCAGLPLITFLLLFFGPTSEESFSKIALWAFYLSWLVNWPHFFASYVEIYQVQRKKIFKSFAHVFSAVLVPMALFLSLYWSFENNSVEGMGAIIQTMFLIVGWHYFRQTYGIASGLARSSGQSLLRVDRIFTQLFLGTIWVFAYLNIQDGRTLQFEGAEYTLFSVDRLHVAYVGYFTIFVAAVFGARHLILFYKSRNLPVAYSVVVLTQVVWSLPLFYERRYFYLIPLFHSLQYLAFIYDHKKKSFATPQEGRRNLVKNYGASLILGMVGFYFLPKFLDNSIELNLAGQFGKTPFMAAAILFINIHHYFIDSVIWKRKHQMREIPYETSSIIQTTENAETFEHPTQEAG